MRTDGEYSSPPKRLPKGVQFAIGRPSLRSQRAAAVALLAVMVGYGGLVRSSAGAIRDQIDAHVRLEREIRSRGDVGRGRFLGRLTGRPDPPLFERPYGVAWRGGDLVVTDPGARAVLRIGARGGVTSTADELFRSPIGVAACSAGLVITDSIGGKVALLDDRMRLQRWIAEGLDRPTGVACVDERIFVVETGQHRVLTFEPTAWMAAIAPPRPSVVETDGLVLIPTADGRSVLVFEQDHVVRTLGRRGSSPGEFNYPTTLALGIGSLWVGDTLNFRLQRFDPVSGLFDGSFGRIGDAAGEMPRLKGMTIDAEERIWVTDAFLDQVALYDEDGSFLSALGGFGEGPLEFSFPAGIAAHSDGRVAIVDSLNRRVQIVRLSAPLGEEEGRRQ